MAWFRRLCGLCEHSTGSFAENTFEPKQPRVIPVALFFLKLPSHRTDLERFLFSRRHNLLANFFLKLPIRLPLLGRGPKLAPKRAPQYPNPAYLRSIPEVSPAECAER